MAKLAEADAGMLNSNADTLVFYGEAKIDGYAPADAAIARLK